MTSNHHYVPQFLLRRFATATRRKHRSVYQLWVRDLKERRTFRANVRDVAAQAGFYRPQVHTGDPEILERSLADLEGACAPALQRLADACSWQRVLPEDRETLALLVLTLYARGPRVRRTFSEIPLLLRDGLKAKGDCVTPELDEYLEQASNADPVPAQASLIIEIARHYPALAARRWVLLIPPVGNRFPCADSPVLLENPLPAGPRSNLGLLSKGVNIMMPVSPHVMLMVADPIHGLPDLRVLHLGVEEFRTVQLLTAAQAERFVYGRDVNDVDLPETAWAGAPTMQVV